MFGLHMPELIIILVVALLIFGPKKLPEMGSAIGKSIKEFRKGVNEISTPQSQPKAEEPATPASVGILESGAASRANVSSVESTLGKNEAASAEIPVE
jgi:sec-independent protein translocase protein TatA